MREIKFRAVGAKNEMIYGLPYMDGKDSTVYHKEFSNRMCWRREEDGAECNQPYKNGTLMQYTGLKDKNGKEIYEKHILNNKYIVDRHRDRFYIIDISNGDMELGGINNDELEITGEYFSLPQDTQRCINKYLLEAERAFKAKGFSFACL